jgi:general secretion pathway protein K
MTPSKHERGVALVAVLWFTVAIAGLAATFATLARGEALRSRNMVETIRARAVLEAALDRAVLELVTPTVLPSPRGIELNWPFAGAEVHIVLSGQSGRLDLNAASPELIAALAKELGADRELAPRIADAVLDWRDENSLRRPKGAEDRDYRSAGREGGAADGPFGHVAELRELLPIEPALYRRLHDLVTVTTGRGEPDSELAAEPVRRAMLGGEALEDKDQGLLEQHESAQPGKSEAADSASRESSIENGIDEPEDEADPPLESTGFVDPVGLYAIRLDARLASGYRAHADAVIWLQETPGGRPYRVLDWDPSPWRAEEPE